MTRKIIQIVSSGDEERSILVLDSEGNVWELIERMVTKAEKENGWKGAWKQLWKKLPALPEKEEEE